MKIIRAGSIPSTQGPDAYFTGRVRIDSPFRSEEPSRLSMALVTFEPGSRTAWHTHPYGQALLVTQGVGRVAVEGGPVESVHPGDIVWFPAGVRHWHGAAPDVAMTHLAIQESRDGSPVSWHEKVSDADYGS